MTLLDLGVLVSERSCAPSAIGISCDAGILLDARTVSSEALNDGF